MGQGVVQCSHFGSGMVPNMGVQGLGHGVVQSIYGKSIYGVQGVAQESQGHSGSVGLNVGCFSCMAHEYLCWAMACICFWGVVTVSGYNLGSGYNEGVQSQTSSSRFS